MKFLQRVRAKGVAFFDNAPNTRFPCMTSVQGLPGPAKGNCRAAAANTPLSRPYSRVARSGSRQDFRGYVLPVETLDEFRYRKTKLRRMACVSSGSRAGVRAVGEVVKTFGTSRWRPKLLTSCATPGLDVAEPLPPSAPLRGPANKQFLPRELHTAAAKVSLSWGPWNAPPPQRGNTRDSTMDHPTD